MQVFLSWSGERSHALALALHRWLPSVLNVVDPFVSSEDIGKGSRWIYELTNQLEKTAYGIVCLTPENQNSQWLIFEAGALSRSLEAGRVTPFLIDMQPSDVIGPLAQFQATQPTAHDVLQLLTSLNTIAATREELSVREDVLKESFRRGWGDFEREITDIAGREADAGARPRPAGEMLSELVDLTRSMERRMSTYQRHLETVQQLVASATPSGRPRAILHVGDVVEHATLGRGIVAEVEAGASDSTLVVDFDALGRKSLSARFAPLVVVVPAPDVPVEGTE